MVINILVAEENIVYDFLIQFPCLRVIYLSSKKAYGIHEF